MKKYIIILSAALSLAGCISANPSKSSIVDSPIQQEQIIPPPSENITKAIDQFKEAIRKDPSNVKNYIELGTLYLNIEKYRQAEDMLSEAVKISPHNAIAHYSLATAQMFLGERTAAVVSANKSAYFFKAIKNERGFEVAVALRDSLEVNPSHETIKEKPFFANPAEIEKNGMPLIPGKDILSVKASSFAGDVRDGKPRSWPVSNIIDNNQNTHWCTEDKVGEWVDIHLKKTFNLSQIGLMNGTGPWNNGKFYYYDARLKKLRIELSDGWKQDIQLNDNGEFQYFDLGGRKTSSVKITVLSLYPREVWSHACLSEIKILAQP